MDHIIPPDNNVILWEGFEAVTSNIPLSDSINNYKYIICYFAVAHQSLSTDNIQVYPVFITAPYSTTYIYSGSDVATAGGSVYLNTSGIKILSNTALYYHLEYHLNWPDAYIFKVIGIK